MILLANTLTISQLQLRIFLLLLLLFSSAVIGYHLLVERPQIQQAISKIIEQQLAALNLAGQQELRNLQTINFDYAVWDDSYAFIHLPNQDYISGNLLDDTFLSLSIDGIVYVDEHFKVIYAKGFDHKKQKPLMFEFYDFAKHPENKVLQPVAKANQQVASQSGILATKYGPALFATTAITHSDRSGEPRGFVLFLRLIDQPLIDQLAKFTFTKITLHSFTAPQKAAQTDDWLAFKPNGKLSSQSEKDLVDILGRVVGKLMIIHPNSEMPPLLDWHSSLFILLFLLLLIIIYALFNCKITQPINMLSRQIKLMGEQEELVKLNELSHIHELSAFARYFNRLVVKIQHQNQLLNQQVYLDPLTNIANRRAFETYLEKQLPLLLRHNLSFTIIIADVDYFKSYNDNHGHIAGDNALVRIAKHLKSLFNRKSDICARYGGEEFIMLYSGIENDQLQQHLTQVNSSFESLNIAHPDSKTRPYITVSLGACLVSKPQQYRDTLSIRDIIFQADQALYYAKKHGRNRAHIVDYQQS